MKTAHIFAAGSLLAAIATTSASAEAANAKVCFEAEGASSVESPIKKVTPGANSKYSGRGYLDIPWDKNKTKGVGKAVVRVNVKTPGLYYLWARTYWANGCGNSIGISVNGGDLATIGEDGTYDKWHWPDSHVRVNLKAGVNTFVIKNKETGVRVDQIFLCQDGDYTPTGIRKVTG